MVNFKTLTKDYSDMTGYLFSFLSQRSVVYYSGDNKYFLSKSDVLGCINYYINLIHCKFGVHVRCADMNFCAFKMHDLVPYLYTLINYYYCLLSEFDGYRRTKRKLKLNRFCRLPFEDEIVVNEKPLCNVKYAVLPALGDDNDTKCVCRLLSGRVLVEDSFDALELRLSNLFPMYRIHLYCDQPF